MSTATSLVFKWNVNYFVSHARYPPCLSLVISPSSGTRYLCLLQQTLRFSFDRSLADFHSDFLSFPSNLPFTTWTLFPLCFLCFRPSSSHTDPSVLEPIRSRYRCRHSFSLSFSLSRSLRLPVRLVHRPTFVSAISSVFAPKTVFGCCVNKSTKVQVSFIVLKHVEFIEPRLKVFEGAQSYRDTVIDWPTFPRYTHRFFSFSSFRLILDDAVAMIARTSQDLSFIIIWQTRNHINSDYANSRRETAKTRESISRSILRNRVEYQMFYFIYESGITFAISKTSLCCLVKQEQSLERTGGSISWNARL